MKISKTLILFLCLVLFGCHKETAKESIASKKQDAINKFEQFYACYEIAKKTPLITKEQINWESNDATNKYDKSNIYQISFANFADLSRPLDIKFDGTRRKEHADMAKLFKIDLSKHTLAHSYKDRKKYTWNSIEDDYTTTAINHFLNSKYLVINRMSSAKSPILLDKKKYLPGHSIGDVLVFDVTKAKLLGGFPFKVENSSSLSLKKYADPITNLKANLTLNTIDRICSKFKKLTPSIKEGSCF